MQTYKSHKSQQTLQGTLPPPSPLLQSAAEEILPLYPISWLAKLLKFTKIWGVSIIVLFQIYVHFG